MTPRTTPAQGTQRRAGRKARGSQLDEATRMAKALSHPLRARVLNALNERVASPVELATEFGDPLGNVSYHVQVLLELDCIELVDTAQRRGAVEHYYRASRRAALEDKAWEQLSRRARRDVGGEWFNKSFADAAAALGGGGFERLDDIHLSYRRLVLDERAWSELSQALREVYERALELEAEAAERLQVGGGAGQMDARLVMAQYEAPAAKRRRRPKRA